MPSTTCKAEVEEGSVFAPLFNADGLLPAIATDIETGAVLMLAWMNAEALQRTLATGEAWYWSRSREELWHKGATSGQIQYVQEMRVDCDQDALWLKVRLGTDRGCCHTGRASCFYRVVVNGQDGAVLKKEADRD
ncbi:phosphoribosyl-AMP cyclohydrolase [Microvirga sp. Mcv34]|uniref:phosphoribosyl-AMP cyclohydrolase n=1 Tax=Microvirga sp. Mcv34 TaxID=2926016 RepID=UPI0021C8992F|nr:phosphoribosyl-AMP cyclohydrolase [Microvirga sp. Mcv34]